MSVEFSFVCQIPSSKQTLYTCPTLPESKQSFSLKGQNRDFIFHTRLKDSVLYLHNRLYTTHTQKKNKARFSFVFVNIFFIFTQDKVGI